MSPERRYAEWLPTSKPPPRPLLATIGAAGVGVAVIGFMLLPLLPVDAITNVAPLLFIPLLVSYSLLVGGFILQWRKQKARVPVRELPALVDQFPAILIVSRETVYGATEGLVSFVDGWLLFSGQGVSLSVRREDIRFSIDDGETAFVFEGPYGRHRALFRPMGKGLQAAWIAWRRGDERPSGRPTYPPLVPLPGRRANRIPRVLALFYLVLGLLSARALPVVGVLEILPVPFILLFDAANRDALRRLASGQPPRTDGLAVALRRAKSRLFGSDTALESPFRGEATIEPLPSSEGFSSGAPETLPPPVVK